MAGVNLGLQLEQHVIVFDKEAGENLFMHMMIHIYLIACEVFCS